MSLGSPWMLAACAALALPTHSARAAEQLPPELQSVTVSQKLGQTIDLSLPFTDHTGQAVTLAKYFGDGKPVLLTLNYYGCKMLCGLQLKTLLGRLKDLEWKPGENFRIVTVS